MEKYSQLPERTVPSSGRVEVHACKLYVTRTWTRGFTKSCPLVWSNDAVGASLRGRRAGKCSGLLSHWRDPTLALTRQLLYCRGASLDALTQPAWKTVEDRSEWDHFRQWEQSPDTGDSYMIHIMSFRNSSVPSVPKFCTTCLYCQGSDWGLRILHLVQLEKLLPLRH